MTDDGRQWDEGAEEPDEPSLLIEDESLEHGFTMIPNVVLRHPNLSRDAKLLYGLLLSYAWQNDRCFPGYDRLTADLGCSRSQASFYMKELREGGFVRVRRRGLGQTNVYTLLKAPRADPQMSRFPTSDVAPAAHLMSRQQDIRMSDRQRTKNTQVEEDSVEEHPEYEDGGVRAAPAAALPYEMESFDATLTGLDGYERDDKLLARLHAAYGERIALDLEAQRIREWALGPKGRGRQINAPFLHNWLKRELRPVALGTPATNGVKHAKEPALDFMGNPRVPGRRYNEFGEPLSANGKFTTDHI